MVVSTEIERQEAINILKANIPTAENPTVYDVRDPFLDGRLYSINFDISDPAGEVLKKMSRVYFHGSRRDFFNNDEYLLTIVGRTARRTLGENILSPSGIAAFIALLLTMCACWLALNAAQIPPLITNGLTVILGFYFGQASRRDA